MKVIVTGSDGFIGKALVKKLVDDGHDVVGCDRKSFQEVKTLTKSDADLLLGTSAIVHLAAQTSVFNRNLRQIEEDNVKAFMDVVDLSNRLGCRLVYASSSCAINVTSMYGLTKRFDEEYAYIYADNSIGVRFHNVYGEGQRPGTLLAEAISCIKKNVPILLYNSGKNKRHFTYLDDIVNGLYWLILDHKQGVVNICNPEENTTKEFVEILGELLPLDYVLTNDVREFDKERQIVNDCISLNEIPYTPLRSGLKKVVESLNF
jgi:UDP-glucuronate 4-epimerase